MLERHGFERIEHGNLVNTYLRSAFEEEGWPEAIDDPLPGVSGIDPYERLHDAVGRLNRAQKEASIRFERDGTGKRVLWRPGE